MRRYKEFWVNTYFRTDTFYWEISTNEFRTSRVWQINAEKCSLEQAVEYVYKDIQEDLKNWDKLSNEMQGYYLERFPGAVIPILIEKYFNKIV